MSSQAQADMLERVKIGNGFIAALDQSGGSTPKALESYGISPDQYNGDEEMFAKVHEMRTRIITSAVFDSHRILGSILFENTLDRDIEGIPTSKYLWEKKQVVPFLKVDKGLATDKGGVQLMKPMPELDALLDKANNQNVFGTKMRLLIKQADAAGIAEVVQQQFEVGKQILAKGLMPIIEPEIDIHSPDKSDSEAILKTEITKQLDDLPDTQQVMLKVSLPNEEDFYKSLVDHPRVLKVVALSGGYSLEDANVKLAANHGVIASFSRALTDGLSAQMSDDDFNAKLNGVIESIYQSSIT
ncbi:fructose bisphosphate aldolase [uncultured Endozoicomonas sp.]|uniref:fructose bisphosphate aldolase n=1 Tax=uncultured Endozoicomonas sp. TaxID=432652 RepID=UPI00260FE092|nr:fructose bisphosphate aldolase [uncultured Endozoicomonas sp.]